MTKKNTNQPETSVKLSEEEEIRKAVDTNCSKHNGKLNVTIMKRSGNYISGTAGCEIGESGGGWGFIVQKQSDGSFKVLFSGHQISDEERQQLINQGVPLNEL